MTITRHMFDDDDGETWDQGEYVSYSDHLAAMAEAKAVGWRAGAAAMREVCGHAADAVGAGVRNCQYLDGQADAWRAVIDCEIPPPPTTSDDGETTP